jgi:hypothetical protein
MAVRYPYFLSLSTVTVTISNKYNRAHTTLDKSTLVRSTASDCVIHIGPSVHALSPTPYPPTVPVISTAVGRRFFPPSLPRRCWPTEWRKLSSTDRVSPNSRNSIVYFSVTKMPQVTFSALLNIPVFSIFRTLSPTRSLSSKSLSCYQQLTDSFFRSCQLFTPAIFCFQRLVDSFAKTRGVWGYRLF